MSEQPDQMPQCLFSYGAPSNPSVFTTPSKVVISRNTTKSHIKNIYGKLDVHSHQELIDLVEGQTQLDR